MNWIKKLESKLNADRQRSCVQKKPWTQTEAEQEAERLTQSEESLFRAYHCNLCDKWHVGHLLSSRARMKSSRRKSSQRA